MNDSPVSINTVLGQWVFFHSFLVYTIDSTFVPFVRGGSAPFFRRADKYIIAPPRPYILPLLFVFFNIYLYRKLRLVSYWLTYIIYDLWHFDKVFKIFYFIK
jgi:hypothetical protein